MKQNEMRKIAMGAVRSQARAQGQNPADLTAKDALAILDDMYRQDKTLVASQWYGAATSYQIDRFDRDWSSWRRYAKEQGTHIMQTDKPKLTLSQAIALQQASNWLEAEAKRAAEQEAADKREQTRQKIADAFWAWFVDETGITDMEDTELVVSISDDYARSFPVLLSIGSVIALEGVSVVWTLPSAPVVKIVFQGEFFELEDGSIKVAPGRNGAWIVFRKGEPKLVAFSFASAAIEAMGLPYEKDMRDANS